MRVGSLFAGIGGFDLAAERAGMEVVWQSEIDPHASRVLAHHWPGVRNYGDIHNMGVEDGDLTSRSGPAATGSGLSPGRGRGSDERYATVDLPDGGTDDGRGLPRVDVLTGGFPCQDYSVAGNRGGLAGDRGALWWEYHRLIAGLRPTWVLGENVPGLLSSNDGRDFETIIGSLVELGYGVAWAVLDAQYFGVAQRRRRVFIVGHSGGVPRPEVLALGEGVFGNPPPRRKTGERVAPSLAARTRGGGGLGTDTELDGALISSLTASHSYDQVGNEDWLIPMAFNWQTGGDMRLGVNGTRTDALHAGQTPAVMAIQDTTRMAKDQNGSGISQDDVGYTLDGQSRPGVVALQGTVIGRGDNAGPGGKGWDDSGAMFTLETIAPHGVAFMENQRGETWEAPVVQAINSGGGKPGQGYPAVRQESSVRRLTPLECERLQGFPDGWTDIPGASDTQRYRQLGNAVAVPVVEWIMKRIVEA